MVKGKKGSVPVERSYYKCTVPNCPVKRFVERAPFQGEQECDISIQGVHNHPVQDDEPTARQVDSWQWKECTNTNKASQKDLASQSSIPELDYMLCHHQLPLSAVMCVCDVSPAKLITWVSPAYEQLTGYNFQELRGKSCSILQGPSTDKEAIAQLRHKFSLQQHARQILLNYKKDQTPFWNLMNIWPVKDETGQIVCWCSISLDVSDTDEAQKSTMSLVSLHGVQNSL